MFLKLSLNLQFLYFLFICFSKDYFKTGKKNLFQQNFSPTYPLPVKLCMTVAHAETGTSVTFSDLMFVCISQRSYCFVADKFSTTFPVFFWI